MKTKTLLITLFAICGMLLTSCTDPDKATRVLEEHSGMGNISI